MSSFKIISMNCRGLADFKKRKDVFMHLRKFKADIICLQDVHVAEGKENSFRNAWGHHSVVATGTHNSRGVAILTEKNGLFRSRKLSSTLQVTLSFPRCW